MKKNVVLLCAVLFSTTIFAQSFNRIAQMVEQAKASKPLATRSFFKTQTGDPNTLPETANAVTVGTLLYWDEAQAQAIMDARGTAISLNIPTTKGSSLELELVPAKNFSDAFRINTPSGPVTNIDLGVHYWGIVKGDPSSMVTISIFKDEMVGVINYKNERYNIGVLPKHADKMHIIYKDTDLRFKHQFTCETDDELHRIGEGSPEITDRSVGPDNCVRMFIETDYTLFQNKGSVANVVSYMTGVMSQVSALYTNESINLVLHELYVWDVADPYTGPSASNYLTQFRNAKNGVYNGDLAHLVGIHGLGGVAYLDVLCNAYYGVGYSSINATYSNVPTYSWTIEVLTHEIGHNLGSPHTHACSWNGNNTAIDGCGPTAGYSEGCTAALPTNGGTIMSYCHLVSGVGINFNNGFGPQPGDRIRSEVYNAPCLNVCGGGGGGCSYTSINSQGFDASWGIWTDGGTDCARINNATYANSPTFSIQLRDNTSTSVMTTTNQNWTAYDEITVDFTYITVSFETGEDFWLQISTNGGSTYTTVGDYNAGTQFTNGVRGFGQVVIPGPFTTNTRLRFRADASADDDQVYIDDVVITGCLQNAARGGDENGTNSRNDNEDNALAEQAIPGINALSFGPNPATHHLNIQFEADKAMEMTVALTDLLGKTVSMQSFTSMEGINHMQIPLQLLTNGIYILNIRAGDSNIVEKVMIQK
jgi:hypothetical protein